MVHYRRGRAIAIAPPRDWARWEGPFKHASIDTPDSDRCGRALYPPDDYWKLPRLPKRNPQRLEHLLWRHCNMRALRSGPDSKRMKTLITRARSGIMLYDHCSVEQLRAFCEARLLSSNTADAGKTSLVNILEQADLDITFDRFLDLPQELRDDVYIAHFDSFQDFTDALRWATPPPVTQVSKQLRYESLSLFYATQRFQIDIFPAQNWDKFGQATTLGCYTEKFLSNTSDQYFRWIRKLRINTALFFTENIEYLGVQWDLDLGTETKEPTLKLVHRDASNAYTVPDDASAIQELWGDLRNEYEPVLNRYLKAIAGPFSQRRLRKSDIDALLEIFRPYPHNDWISRADCKHHGWVWNEDQKDTREFQEYATKVIGGIQDE